MMTRRSLRIGIAAAILLGATGQSAPASDAGAGCGSDPAKPATKWTTSSPRQCHFQFRGFPLIARGDATATGTASVHVWISLVQGGPPLVECSRSANGSAGCQTGVPDSTTPVQVQPLQTIWCHVQGVGTGNYWCQSAYGI